MANASPRSGQFGSTGGKNSQREGAVGPLQKSGRPTATPRPAPRVDTPKPPASASGITKPRDAGR